MRMSLTRHERMFASAGHGGGRRACLHALALPLVVQLDSERRLDRAAVDP
jgi:hypothetical protein